MSELPNKIIIDESFDELLDILSVKISGLVTDIEENCNDTKENRSLLEKFDFAFDELNENEYLDFDYLNFALKK